MVHKELNSSRFGLDMRWHGQEVESPAGGMTKIGDMLRQLRNGPQIRASIKHQRDPEEDMEAKMAVQEDGLGLSHKRPKIEPTTGEFLCKISHTSPGAPQYTGFQGGQLQMFARVPNNSFHPLDEPSPLGLKLRKTPSLLDLVSMCVTKSRGGDIFFASTSGDGLADHKQESFLPGSFPSQGKLKASNFPAKLLRIGSWERHSRYEGDVVAKCYYAKRKLVWEVLENGLKSKIEVQWSDISAIQASFPENQPAVLEVEVSRPPLFSKETNPQPRKHTLWEATSDFTGGEATVCKRHYLEFPEGILNRHYEKLLQCDARLRALASRNGRSKVVPNEDDARLSSLTETNDGNYRLAKYETDSMAHYNELHSNSVTEGSSYNKLISEGIVKLEPLAVSDSECSRSSCSGFEDGCSGAVDGGIRFHEFGALAPIHEVEEEKPSVSSGMGADLNHKSSRGVLLLTGNVAQSDKLNELAQILLGEPSISRPLHEQGLIRVGSMSAFLSDDQASWLPTSYTFVDGYSGPDDNLNKSGYYNEQDCFEDLFTYVELDVKQIKDDGISSGTAGLINASLDSVKQCFSRHASAGDLLVNLPRIASLPQLFEPTLHSSMSR